MMTVLLNPPRRRRRRNKGTRAGALKGWATRRKKYGKRGVKSRRKGSRRSSRKAFAKRTKWRMSRKVGRTMSGKFTRRQTRTKADPMGALPAVYRKKSRSRRQNKSTWVPDFDENPRRRNKRRKARNSGASYNYGRKHRSRGRNKSTWLPIFGENPSWVPQYAMNPGLSLSAVTAGYKPANLKKALPVAGGMVANMTAGRALTKAIGSAIGINLSSGFAGVASSVATAGLMGAAAGMVNRKWSGPIFLGGLIDAMAKIASGYVLPALGMSGCCGGLGDYALNMLTEPYLPDFEETTDLNYAIPSFAQASDLNPGEYGMQGMGDYLTPQNATDARALGHLSGSAWEAAALNDM